MGAVCRSQTRTTVRFRVLPRMRIPCFSFFFLVLTLNGLQLEEAHRRGKVEISQAVTFTPATDFLAAASTETPLNATNGNALITLGNADGAAGVAEAQPASTVSPLS